MHAGKSPRMRGICATCGKQRAFVFTGTHVQYSPIQTMGGLPLMEAYGPPMYSGRCSTGHDGLFDPIVRQTMCKDKFRREPNPKMFGGSRDGNASYQYGFWLNGFRKRNVEAHFKPNHECDKSCPKYDWSEYDWDD